MNFITGFTARVSLRFLPIFRAGTTTSVPARADNTESLIIIRLEIGAKCTLMRRSAAQSGAPHHRQMASLRCLLRRPATLNQHQHHRHHHHQSVIISAGGRAGPGRAGARRREVRADGRPAEQITEARCEQRPHPTNRPLMRHGIR